MTERWLVSVPVWGERCVDEFVAAALPSIQLAVHALEAARGVDVRLVVHTDQPERVCAATDVVVEVRPVPAGSRGFDCMSQAHREMLATGLLGDVVVLMTAGVVISAAGLSYCAEVFGNPRVRVVLCAVPRVLAAGVIPDTTDAPGLMSWGWENRHPMTSDCTWPDGRSVDLSRTFFTDGDSVVTRQALPHPLAVRIDGRVLRFTPTVDANLIQCFDRSEMHVATDCRSLAMLKLSPADKGYQVSESTMAERAAAGKIVITDPLQRWSLSHRVVLRGDDQFAGCGDDQFMAAIRGG